MYVMPAMLLVCGVIYVENRSMVYFPSDYRPKLIDRH